MDIYRLPPPSVHGVGVDKGGGVGGVGGRNNISCCNGLGEDGDACDSRSQKKRKSVLLIIVDKANGMDNRVFLGLLLGVFVFFALTIVLSLFMLSIYIWLK